MKRNPILTANPVSKLFVCWLEGLFRTGYRRKLGIHDIYDVCPTDRSEVLGDKLEKVWKAEVRQSTDTNRDPSFLRVLCRLLGFKYLIFSVFLLIEEGLNIAQPILLGALIDFFTQEPTITKTEAYIYAMAISVSAILQAILYHPYHFYVSRQGMRIKTACCSLMYRKCLCLSSSGLNKTSTGQIVNLLSNDVQRIQAAVINLPFLFVGPMLAVIVTALYWDKLGKPLLSGIAILLVLVIAQALLSRLFSRYRMRTARLTDKRVSMMNEIIAGIRTIKMYCWEYSFRDLIANIRRSEIQNVRMTNYLFAVQETISRYGRYLCLYATILFYVLSNQTFQPGELYMIVGLLHAISLHAVMFLSHAVQHIVRAAVSINRIKTFLQLEEVGSGLEADGAKLVNDVNNTNFIEINSATAKWVEAADRPTLSNISASVKEKELLAVIGPVGAGKSSLLLTILKELPLISGEIRINGRLAYVSQQAWVLPESIKENIVFGNEFNETKYKKIVQACALDKDISLLPHGDSTIVGDRGVKLSGGQRARINLARSLYMDGDIYLIDDPFSAVDTNVARHIFKRVIQDILKDRPVILVTHSLHFLKSADKILVLNEGQVSSIQAYDDLYKLGGLPSFLHDKVQPYSNESSNVTFSQLPLLQNNKLKKETKQDNDQSDAKGESQINPNKTEENKGNDRIEEEKYQEGVVDWNVYLKYFQLGTGIFTSFVLVCLWLATQAVFIVSDWWLSRWSNDNQAILVQSVEGKNGSDSISATADETMTNFAIYSGLIMGLMVVAILRAFLFFHIAVTAAERAHNTMFHSIIRSTVAFFDVNPVGRVLNRFSKDMGQIDEGLPLTLFDFMQCSLYIAGMVIVTGVVNPWVFIAIVPLCVVLVALRHFYIQTSRQLRRISGVTRSPTFTHLSATLPGLHTIRAFASQEKFQKDFDRYQDNHTATWFLLLASDRWFTLRLDVICALFVTAVSFGSVLAASSLDAGLVGFSVTYAFAVMGICQWTVIQSTKVETEMVSVERVLDYCKLPSEAPLETDARSKPKDTWPETGKIQCISTHLKYFDPLPYILRDLTFTIYGNEKIGIVGRTGAGKSSIVAMLMRLTECEGTVKIDGVHVKNIGLHALRNKISVIPQDPILFTGRLRQNLDPFGQHDEVELWQVLEDVEMRQAVEVLSRHGLDSEISEGGQNFSVGQRQLLCLARAMLRKSKILIIDEATANVDTRTDQLIQKTIRERFAHCTVLTIAHRLNTVMDSDRILVIDQGRVQEFDHPFLLLQNEDGFLYRMVKDMHNLHDLLGTAKASFVRKSSTQL